MDVSFTDRPEEKAMSWTERLRLVAVLEDCSDQLFLVEHSLKVQKVRAQGQAGAREIARLKKLNGHCQDISRQISSLHWALEKGQSYSSFLDDVEKKKQKKECDNMIRNAKRELEERAQTLQRQKEELQEKNWILKDLYHLATHLKCQQKEQSLEIAYRKKTVEKIMEMQHQLEINRAEQLLEEQLELLQKQLKEESRVHEESRKYLQNQHEEVQQKLEEWQQRTQQMLQEKKQQLNNVCCQKTVNLDKVSEMRRKFREMEQVVMDDREEQEKLRQQQAEARAATKLQAWWRGCMVRRGLGAFKTPDKSKKGKKKEGKKEKKKKEGKKEKKMKKK
uniref:Dynein regulatory complex protein 9 n=1 Tax=Monopterus albus TaxID=43700 RepID=A0A3Q3J379_MONAL|nr:IQ domain-containing protein G-like [Monopterus albus]